MRVIDIQQYGVRQLRSESLCCRQFVGLERKPVKTLRTPDNRFEISRSPLRTPLHRGARRGRRRVGFIAFSSRNGHWFRHHDAYHVLADSSFGGGRCRSSIAVRERAVGRHTEGYEIGERYLPPRRREGKGPRKQLIALIQRHEDRADDDGHPSRTTYQGSVDQRTTKTFPARGPVDASLGPHQESALEFPVAAYTLGDHPKPAIRDHLKTGQRA